MEPWKLAAIAALGAGIIGYGVFSNSSANRLPVNPSGGLSATAATAVPSKFVGTTLPPWPAMKQWMNSPAPVSLSSLKGKTVLLEVFRTECSHCQEAAPFLKQLHARYAPRGVNFVGVQSPAQFNDAENPENNWKLVQSWVKAHGYTWPVGFDAKSAWYQGKFGKDVYYPALFLIDKTGKVAWFQSGYDREKQKAVQLAVELEQVAPGNGDTTARSADLARFISPELGLSPADKDAQQSLANDLASRLGGGSVAQSTASMAPSPALWLAMIPVGAGVWLWKRRAKTGA